MTTIVVGSIVVRQTKSGDQLSFRFDTDKALWQGYNSETGAVVPDWSVAGNQPTLTPKAFSARLGQDVAKVGTGVWSYNGVAITFDAGTGISTNFNGAFQIDFATDELTIIKDLASSSNQNNDLLTYTGNWDNGYAESAGGQAEIVIDRVGTSPFTGIVNLSTNTLNEVNGVTSLTATAVLMRGTTVMSTGDYTRKWYKEGDATVLGTGVSLTIDRSMVSGKENFYCEFYVDGVLQSVYYFPVYDMSDPAQLVFDLLTPYDQTDAGKDVQYSVKLVRSGDGSQITSASLTATFYNSRHQVISGGTSGLTVVSGTGTLTVTYADGEALDGTDGLKNGSIEARIEAQY